MGCGLEEWRCPWLEGRWWVVCGGVVEDIRGKKMAPGGLVAGAEEGEGCVSVELWELEFGCLGAVSCGAFGEKLVSVGSATNRVA